MNTELAWTPDMAVGIPQIDQEHQVLLAQIARVLAAPDAELEEAMLALADSIERDFRAEEDLMESIDYPVIHSHREQHARVLASLHSLPAGDLAQARHAVGLLASWFRVHLATMDTVMALALQAAGVQADPQAPPAA